jgi:hypothetical protein
MSTVAMLTAAPQRQQPPAGAQWNRVTPWSDASQWLISALQELARLASLPENWDGYGSPRLCPAALRAARRLVGSLEQLALPAPHVLPVTGGGIGFTWQCDSRELEVEVSPNGSARYLAVLTDSDTGEEATEEADLSLDRPEQAERLAAWLIG